MSRSATVKDSPRVLVTGAAGMLGIAMVARFRERHTVQPMTRSDADLTDAQSCIEWIVKASPQIIVHVAAWTDVDACEADPDRAFRDNGLATRNVALAAQRLGASMCYISSDYVFDGRKSTPYREYDSTSPLGVYGRSKLWGEEVVQRLVRQHWIARTSWLYGSGGRNFVQTMAHLLASRSSVQVVDDQRGSPTYTLDLAAAIVELVHCPVSGVYHVTNAGECTWFGLARRIAGELGSSCRVTPCRTAQFPRPAPRPGNSVLEPWAWQSAGLPLLRPWEQAVADYLVILRQQAAAHSEEKQA